MGSSTTAKRITLGSWLAGCMFLGTAFAQPSVTGSVDSVRFETVPAGLQVVVDGVTYNTPTTLLWPQFSTHTVHTFNQGAAASGARYLFQNWNSNQGQITSSSAADPTTIVVTADPNITEIDANFAAGYLVSLTYVNCPGYSDPGNPCPPNLTPGAVVVGGIRYTMSANIYALGPLTLQAIPSP